RWFKETAEKCHKVRFGFRAASATVPANEDTVLYFADRIRRLRRSVVLRVGNLAPRAQRMVWPWLLAIGPSNLQRQCGSGDPASTRLVPSAEARDFFLSRLEHRDRRCVLSARTC